MTYDAVIFDNDGVLVEPTPEPVHQTTNRLAFRSCGVKIPVESHITDLGNPSVMLLDAICNEYGIDPATFWATRERYAIKAQRYEIENGGKPPYEDVDIIRSLSVPIGVVSNNQRETVEFILNKLDLTDKIKTVYGRLPSLEGLETLKPNPINLERAMDDLCTRNALFVGDSREDVEAATAAGIDSAFLRRAHRLNHELPIEPTYEIGSLRELPRLLDAQGSARSSTVRSRSP